jgi:hypothetical protein
VKSITAGGRGVVEEHVARQIVVDELVRRCGRRPEMREDRGDVGPVAVRSDRRLAERHMPGPGPRVVQPVEERRAGKAVQHPRQAHAQRDDLVPAVAGVAALQPTRGAPAGHDEPGA